MNYNEICRMTSTIDAHELQKENSRAGQGAGSKGLWTDYQLFTLLLRISDQQREKFTSFKIWTCSFRIVRSNPKSGEMSAKWRA